MTYYDITLSYNNKNYTFQDEHDYQDRDDIWTADYQVEWMYTEGNFSCDCNRSLFLYYSDCINFGDDPHAVFESSCDGGNQWLLPCGNTIKLVSIKEGKRVIYG